MSSTTTRNKTTKKPIYKKKKFVIPFIVIILLIGGRIYLPYWVKDRVNNTLANIPGYYGQVKDIDIALIRGAYVIDGLYLNKVDAGTQIPYLNFPKTDISIEWKSILKGKIVSEIVMYDPKIIYVVEDQEVNEDADANVEDWTKALTKLVPIEINHYEVHNGSFSYVQLAAEPNIDLQINKIEFTADNLRNVVEKTRSLPSSINLTGVSTGNGIVKGTGNINLIKEIPDMDLNISLSSMDATGLNDFTNYYAGIDFEEGDFDLYTEFAIADGNFKGYIKPLLKNSKLIGKEDGFLETIWEGFTGFFEFILKNQKTDTIATRIPLEGNLNGVSAGIFPAITNTIKNGWIKAFQGDIDSTIEYEDAFESKKDMTREEKKELRKTKREKKRAERKADDN